MSTVKLAGAVGLSAACLLTLPCLALGNADGVQELACAYGYQKPMTSGEAKLNIKDGRVSRVWFNNYFPGGQGELGFTCHIDWSRQDEDYVWQEHGLAVFVIAKASGDALRLTRSRKGYRLDFSDVKTLSNYCGAGAEVPVSVFIPNTGKSCKVSLPK